MATTMTTMQDTIVQQCEGSALFTLKTLTTMRTEQGLHVKGFASINGVDRQGDEIDAALFDIKAFMANPQLWFEHSKWKRMDGNEVSIGIVEKMVFATVKRVTNEGVMPEEYAIIENETGKLLDTVTDTNSILVKNGDKGLWVVANVLEDDVITLIEQKRLNAFSWQGLIYRKPNGKAFKIDVMEVSIVHLPANQRALFMVGKAYAMSAQPKPEFVLAPDPINQAQYTNQASITSRLTVVERLLFGDNVGHTNTALQEGTVFETARVDEDATEMKGGDATMTQEEMKKLFSDSLAPVLETVTALAGKVDELYVKAETVDPDDTVETALDETIEPAAVVEEGTAVDDTPVSEAETTTKTNDEEDTKAFAAVFADALKPLVASIDQLGKRVRLLESKPQKSQTSIDADSTETDIVATIEKQFSTLNDDQKKSVRRGMLAHSLIPNDVVRRS